jgi:hypothetical protein
MKTTSSFVAVFWHTAWAEFGICEEAQVITEGLSHEWLDGRTISMKGLIILDGNPATSIPAEIQSRPTYRLLGTEGVAWEITEEEAQAMRLMVNK